MSVFTPLDQDTLIELCSEFGVQANRTRPISEGVENSNWYVSAGQTEYVLTLFEQRGLKDVRVLCQLLEALDDAAIPVALPLMHELDARCAVYIDKPMVLSPRLPGSSPSSITPAVCQIMGSVLAKLHSAMQQLPSKTFALQSYDAESARDRLLPGLPLEHKKALYATWQRHAKFKNKLPKGLIHGDLFSDNTLWEGGNLTGLLDFTETSFDDLLMDLCITGNDFCRQFDGSFDASLWGHLLSGYESVRELFDVEIEAINPYLAMAAARFWMMRLEREVDQSDQLPEVITELKPSSVMRDLCLEHLSHSA